MTDPRVDGIDRLETPERVGLTIDLAGVGSRTLAFLLDWLILFAVSAVTILAITTAGVAIRWHTATVIALYAVGFVLWWLYFALFEALWNGQTPGKRVLGLRVQKVGGYPIGWPEALIRNFLRVLIDLFLFGVPIGLVVMVLGRRNQRIGDLAAGTVVVRERRGGLEQLAEIGFGVDDTAPDTALGRIELTSDEFETVHDFLVRVPDLDPACRDRIGTSLAAVVRDRLEGRGAMQDAWRRLDDGPFLIAVDAAYRGIGRE